MAPSDAPRSCSRCSKTFAQKSSLVRHSKRCLGEIKLPSRQKACRQCTNAKSRCDLQRPHCGRCLSRSLACAFQLDDGTSILPRPGSRERPPESAQSSTDRGSPAQNGSRGSVAASPPHSPFDEARPLPSSTDNSRLLEMSAVDNGHAHARIAPELVILGLRNQARLESSSTNASTGAVARHIMFFVIRVLQSWPRMMSGPHACRLPPIIHHLQVVDGLPLPLAQCSTLVKTWTKSEDSNRSLVHDLIRLEVKRLLQQHHLYTGTDLLAATQSLLILAIILLFGSNKTPGLSSSEGAKILVEMWDVKHRLADTGMFIKEETDHILPPWKEWAIVSAKRRTILAFHHVEWVWSMIQGYPILTCFELAPSPAPSPGYLWSERDEASWRRQYNDWLIQWKDGSYKMGELFDIKPGESLDVRSEMWLAEVDEFGLLLMSEINAVNCVD